MRIIKLAIISFVFLFLLVTAISLFFPSHIRISKAVNLKADKDSVMNLVRDVNRWKSWYPGLDSTRQIIENGRPIGVYLHSGDSSHPLEIRLTGEKENEVTAQMTNRRLKPVSMGWNLITYSQTDSITLQWYMDFHLRWYPWEKFGSLLLEHSYGARMELGLSRIRRQVQP
jgi:hypothetical protein